MTFPATFPQFWKGFQCPQCIVSSPSTPGDFVVFTRSRERLRVRNHRVPHWKSFLRLMQHVQLCDAFLEDLGMPCHHPKAWLFSLQSEGTRNPPRNKCFMTMANRCMVQVVFKDVYLFTYNKFIFIIFIIFCSPSFCLSVCVWMYVYAWSHKHTHTQCNAGDQGGIGYPEIEVTGICELPDVGTGNKNHVPCKSSKYS